MARGGAAVGPASGVSDGFAALFFFGVGDSEPDWPFPGVVFFFFFPFGEPSFAADFFGLGWVVASGVSFGVADASDSPAADFFFFGFGDGSDSSAGYFFAFGFFFGEGDGDVVFVFLCGNAFDFGEGVGVFSLAGDSIARAFRIGLPSSVCCA